MKFIHCADVHLDTPLQGLAHYPGAPVSEINDQRSMCTKLTTTAGAASFLNTLDALIEQYTIANERREQAEPQ